MRLLVVEDDVETGSFLKKSFEKECFATDWEKDGDKASYTARTNEYDLIILDCNIPTKNGVEVAREIRGAGRGVPIIMLTVTDHTSAKVLAFEAGADDYLTKPFYFEELLARSRALLRRPPVVVTEVMQIADLYVDVRSQSVKLKGRAVYLTRKEFQLLEYLMRNAGRVVSRGMLMEHVWDSEADPFSNTIETHVLNLRRKIDQGNRKLIHTLPGRGYKLE